METEGDAVGRIGRGLLVYVGVASDDGPADVEYAAEKIAGTRIFPDEAGKMNLDVRQIGGAVLVVSNFTLQADTRQGRRPSFVGAARPEQADALYRGVCDRLRAQGIEVQTGRFGAAMRVSSVGAGPVNIWIDTRAVCGVAGRGDGTKN